MRRVGGGEGGDIAYPTVIQLYGTAVATHTTRSLVLFFFFLHCHTMTESSIRFFLVHSLLQLPLTITHLTTHFSLEGNPRINWEYANICDADGPNAWFDDGVEYSWTQPNRENFGNDRTLRIHNGNSSHFCGFRILRRIVYGLLKTHNNTRERDFRNIWKQ